jgi:carbon monoxide dehydrogenase subunit G
MVVPANKPLWGPQGQPGRPVSPEPVTKLAESEHDRSDRLTTRERTVVAVQRTFPVNRPAPVIRDYLQDFSHAEQWLPATRKCTPTSEPPIGVGSTWHNVSEVMGREVEIDFTLQEAEENRLVFVGQHKAADITVEFVLMPETEHRTAVGFTVHIDFHGAVRLAAPVVQHEVEKRTDEAIEKLTNSLEAL